MWICRDFNHGSNISITKTKGNSCLRWFFLSDARFEALPYMWLYLHTLKHLCSWEVSVEVGFYHECCGMGC